MLHRTILLLVLLILAYSSTDPIQAGSYIIISSTRTAGYSASVQTTFANAFSTTPYVILSLIDLVTKPNVTAWGVNFQIIYPQTPSYFINEFTLVSPDTVVTRAKLRYLAVDHVDYPNYLVRYYSGPFRTTMGGLAQGSGRRNESYDLSIVGGLFSLSEPISIIAFMVGFQGSFDLVTFSLESSVEVINQTHMRLAFSADDNNIYTNASAYIIAFLNNITCYADVGHLYGYQYNQINSIVNVTLPTTFFIGLCRFAVNDSRLNIMLTGDDMNINSGSNYWNLTYSYIYFRLDILCGSDPCPCYDGYHQDSNGVCQEVCQDGRSYELPCDDGNSINGDGCSDTCQVEQYYYCYNTGGRSASFCYFVGPLSLTYSDATKLAGSNKANVTFSVTPAYNDMGSIPWQNILSASNKFSIESVSYSDGTLSVIGSYTSNMSVQTSTVFISTPPSGNYQYIIPSNLSFKATYNDHGFPVLLFTTDQYSFGEAFKYIVLTVDVLYWIALLFALYCSKFIGIEMMSVLQMSYLAILTLDHRAPAVENLPYLKYSVGINPLFQDIQSYSPIRVLRMGYRSQFMADYNLAVLTFIGCLLVGLGMYIYHIVRKRSDTDQEDLKNKQALNITHVFSDWILVVALFNVYGIVFAFTINILFQPSINIIDVAFGAVMVLGLIGIAVYYGLKNREFKECMLFFNVAKDVKLARYHPVFMMADRFVYSIIAAAIGQNSYATYVLMVWVLAYTLFVCFKNPYQLKKDYYRSLGTQCCALVILALYCFMRNGNNLSIAAYTYIPVAVMLVLLVNLAVNLAFIAMEFKVKMREKREENENKENLQKMLKEMRKAQEIEMSLITKTKEWTPPGGNYQAGQDIPAYTAIPDQ